MRYLIQLVLIGFIGYLLIAVLKILKKEDLGKGRFGSSPAVEEILKDPICGTYVPVSQALKFKVDGQNFYFCSKECLEKYQKEKSGDTGEK